MPIPEPSVSPVNRRSPKLRIVRFLLVNAFTATNLLLGVLSMLFTVGGYLVTAAMLLLASALLDMLDGNLARRWRVQSDFGAQMDSLADMTAFTLAGALLMYHWLSPELPPALAMGTCGAFVLMGAIRLARFNSGASNTSYFQGIPTTAAGGILAIAYLTLPTLAPMLAAVLFMVLAVLMVSTLPYCKFAVLKRLPKLIWVAIAAGLVLNAGLAAWVVSGLYLLSGPAIWLRTRRAGAA